MTRLLLLLWLSPAFGDCVRPDPTPWVVADGKVDVDGDGVADSIQIETRDGCRVQDEEPCAGCGDRIEGHFVAVVRLSRSRRSVSTPIALHPKISGTMWFWNRPYPSGLSFGDYNGDGRADFNLGQFTNSVKWEYGLFTIHRDGRVHQFALDHPEIYVAPGDVPSTDGIEPIPGGIRFRDYGNADDPPGWWVFTCRWQAKREAFTCSSRRD